ncbi:hypothetical protein Tco_1506779 [Tanacetum coccineum]
MRDENPIRTLRDYFKPSHEGYRNTIELPVGNNVVPLRSDTIWLVQNGFSFHGLRSEDPNQHLKDFLKLVDSLDLDEGLQNSVMISLCSNKDLLTKGPHHDIDLWLQVQIFYDHVNPVTRQTIDQSVGDKLRDKNAKESWALLEDLALYDNKSWNDPSDFAKPIKAISLPQDVPSTSDRRLVELKSSPTLDGSSFCSDTTYSNKAEEEGSLKSGATEYRNLEMTIKDEEEIESEEEFEEGTKEETEEEEEGDPEHFNTFPTMNELRLEPRRKLSNPKKNYNFVGRVRGLKVFVGNFTYECDFMVLEDMNNVIDHYLGSVLFGKPFVEATGLVYNKEEGTVVFERDKEKIIFKIPYKMYMFKHIDFTDISTGLIPPFVIKSGGDNCEKTYYSDSLDLGPEYKYDEYVCRGIRSLMATKAIRKNKREVT